MFLTPFAPSPLNCESVEMAEQWAHETCANILGSIEEGKDGALSDGPPVPAADSEAGAGGDVSSARTPGEGPSVGSGAVTEPESGSGPPAMPPPVVDPVTSPTKSVSQGEDLAKRVEEPLTRKEDAPGSETRDSPESPEKPSTGKDPGLKTRDSSETPARPSTGKDPVGRVADSETRLPDPVVPDAVPESGSGVKCSQPLSDTLIERFLHDGWFAEKDIPVVRAAHDAMRGLLMSKDPGNQVSLVQRLMQRYQELRVALGINRSIHHYKATCAFYALPMPRQLFHALRAQLTSVPPHLLTRLEEDLFPNLPSEPGSATSETSSVDHQDLGNLTGEPDVAKSASVEEMASEVLTLDPLERWMTLAHLGDEKLCKVEIPKELVAEVEGLGIPAIPDDLLDTRLPGFSFHFLLPGLPALSVNLDGAEVQVHDGRSHFKVPILASATGEWIKSMIEVSLSREVVFARLLRQQRDQSLDNLRRFTSCLDLHGKANELSGFVHRILSSYDLPTETVTAAEERVPVFHKGCQPINYFEGGVVQALTPVPCDLSQIIPNRVDQVDLVGGVPYEHPALLPCPFQAPGDRVIYAKPGNVVCGEVITADWRLSPSVLEDPPMPPPPSEDPTSSCGKSRNATVWVSRLHRRMTAEEAAFLEAGRNTVRGIHVPVNVDDSNFFKTTRESARLPLIPLGEAPAMQMIREMHSILTRVAVSETCVSAPAPASALKALSGDISADSVPAPPVGTSSTTSVSGLPEGERRCSKRTRASSGADAVSESVPAKRTKTASVQEDDTVSEHQEDEDWDKGSQPESDSGLSERRRTSRRKTPKVVFATVDELIQRDITNHENRKMPKEDSPNVAEFKRKAGALQATDFMARDACSDHPSPLSKVWPGTDLIPYSAPVPDDVMDALRARHPIVQMDERLGLSTKREWAQFTFLITVHSTSAYLSRDQKKEEKSKAAAKRSGGTYKAGKYPLPNDYHLNSFHGPGQLRKANLSETVFQKVKQNISCCVCVFCGLLDTNQESLVMHMKFYHYRVVYTCVVCDTTFRNPSRFYKTQCPGRGDNGGFTGKKYDDVCKDIKDTACRYRFKWCYHYGYTDKDFSPQNTKVKDFAPSTVRQATLEDESFLTGDSEDGA